VCGFQLVFVATHLPAFLGDRGLPTWVGAWTLAMVGLFNIVGSYGCGWLGGRYSKKNLLALVYSLRSFAFLLFMVMPLSEFSVLLFGALLGLLWLGTVPLTSGLVAHIFGPAYMSMLYGIVFFSHQVGSFLGAWMGGYFYDLFGSYDAMWWICVALGFAASALHLPIAERPVARLGADDEREARQRRRRFQLAVAVVVDRDGADVVRLPVRGDGPEHIGGERPEAGRLRKLVDLDVDARRNSSSDSGPSW
jgi:MFS family permease